MDRQTIRDTAGRVLRSDDLAEDEKEQAASFLRANTAMGNPHMVRCDWCHEAAVLFRDEDTAQFTRTARGWRCAKCDDHSASQEIRF